MNDLLSQEEIDALLGAGGDSDTPAEDGAGSQTSSSYNSSNGASTNASLSQEDLDQLSEVAKLSLGATSSVIQVLLNQEIEINLEQLRIVNFGDMADEGGSNEFVIARIAYIEGFDGNSYLMLKKSITAVIGDLMMGGPGAEAEFQEMHLSAVGEMLNQMMGKTTTSLSEIFKKRVDISPPNVITVNFQDGPPDMPDFNTSAVFLRIGYSLKIGDVAETEMVQLLPIDFAKGMALELATPVEKKASPAPQQQQPQQPQQQQQQQHPAQGGMPNMGMHGQMPGMPNMGMPGQMPGMPNMGMPGQMPGMPNMGMPGQMPGMPNMGMHGQMPGMQGSPAEFGMLQMPGNMGLQSNIDLLLDVPLQITVELGRTRMLIKDVLELGIGSVVELNKLAGEAVEVFVNSKLIAKGEVVVIDENFAVRITSIINPQDRL